MRVYRVCRDNINEKGSVNYNSLCKHYFDFDIIMSHAAIYISEFLTKKIACFLDILESIYLVPVLLYYKINLIVIAFSDLFIYVLDLLRLFG